MSLCDANAVKIILEIVIGGITLRGAIAWLKKKLKAKGLGAFLITLLCCAAASALYILLWTILFKGGQWIWICFLWYTFEIFAGSQTAYRFTKHLIYPLPKKPIA